MDFFEVKVKYYKETEDGINKMVSETYAIDACSFTEAEARITREIYPYTVGDFIVAAEKRAQYKEVVFHAGDLFFLVKYVLINLVDGKEHRSAMYVLFRAETIDKAKEHARDYMKGSVTDYEIESIKETKIIDVLMKDEPLAC